MSPNLPDPLILAFEAAAGRGAGAAAPDPLRRFAARVVAAGRRLAQAPTCPLAALRRAEALFQAPAARGVARLLALVFDSFHSPLPAVRGLAGPRLLRFAQDQDQLDVEVWPEVDGGHRLRIAAPLTAAGGALTAQVTGGPRAVRVSLDASGVGELRLPSAVRRFQVVLRTGRRERARTPEVLLDGS